MLKAFGFILAALALVASTAFNLYSVQYSNRMFSVSLLVCCNVDVLSRVDSAT